MYCNNPACQHPKDKHTKDKGCTDQVFNPVSMSFHECFCFQYFEANSIPKPVVIISSQEIII